MQQGIDKSCVSLIHGPCMLFVRQFSFITRKRSWKRVLGVLKIDTDLNRRWYCRKPLISPAIMGSTKSIEIRLFSVWASSSCFTLSWNFVNSFVCLQISVWRLCVWRSCRHNSTYDGRNMYISLYNWQDIHYVIFAGSDEKGETFQVNNMINWGYRPTHLWRTKALPRDGHWSLQSSCIGLKFVQVVFLVKRAPFPHPARKLSRFYVKWHHLIQEKLLPCMVALFMSLCINIYY